MRYIVMHKTNAHYEAGGRPSEDLINRVGAFIGDLMASGRFVSGEGLRPTSEGARLHLTEGGRRVTPGPFTGEHELPQGFTVFRAPSLDAAVEWAAREAAALGVAEVDVRPLTEAWDLGLAPAPTGQTSRRYMSLHKATRESEAGAAPTAAQRTGAEQAASSAPGPVLASERLRPSARGRRYRNAEGGITATDGPFAESKELVGGYVILHADSLDALDQFVRLYLRDVDTREVDVREVED